MNKTFWTKQKINELRDLWTNPEISVSDIAIELKTTYDAVKHAIRRYNLTHYRKRYNKDKASSSTTEKMLESIDDRNFEKAKKNAKLSWNVPKSKLSKKSQLKGWKTYLITSDFHIPYHNEPCIKSILNLMDDVRFDGHILNGDFMDLEPISHWTKNKKKTLEGRRLKEDYIIGNAILDEFDKRLPKKAEKHFLWGNHEDWYNQFIEELPALEGFGDPNEELYLEKRGYKVHIYNDIIKFGKLSITHGIYASQNTAKKHVSELKTNILVGHVHTQEERYDCSEARELAMGSYTTGALCDLAPSYMRNRPHKWTHGFAILYVEEKTGFFFVDLKRIVRGRFIHNGKLYDGKSKEDK